MTQQDYHSCTPADAASGRIASQQVVSLIGGMQQNACGSAAWSLLFEVSQDFGTCGGSGSAQALTGPIYPTLTQLVAGPPTVNGEPPGSTPGAAVATGDPANIDVPVTNVGDAPVTGIDGSTPIGDITCVSSDLQPGASTSCTMTVPSTKGPAVPVTVSGTDPSGRPLIATARVLYDGAGPTPLGAMGGA